MPFVATFSTQWALAVPPSTHTSPFSAHMSLKGTPADWVEGMRAVGWGHGCLGDCSLDAREDHWRAAHPGCIRSALAVQVGTRLAAAVVHHLDVIWLADGAPGTRAGGFDWGCGALFVAGHFMLHFSFPETVAAQNISVTIHRLLAADFRVRALQPSKHSQQPALASCAFLQPTVKGFPAQCSSWVIDALHARHWAVNALHQAGGFAGHSGAGFFPHVPSAWQHDITVRHICPSGHLLPQAALHLSLLHSLVSTTGLSVVGLATTGHPASFGFLRQHSLSQPCAGWDAVHIHLLVEGVEGLPLAQEHWPRRTLSRRLA